jgi:hypothetical protein
MRIDHVIFAAADLEAAAARVAGELGVAIAGGGRHDGMGTENRIVPLGGGYLEILAVVDPGEAAGSALGRQVAERIFGHGDGLIGWAVSVDDAGAEAQRLGASLSTISRDGFSARLAGVVEAMRDPYLPFFVQRDQGVANPGTAGPVGGIAWIELAGDPTRLDDWLGGAELPVRVVAGTPGVRAIGIGDREFRP